MDKQLPNNVTFKNITAENETEASDIGKVLFEVANSGVKRGSPWTIHQFIETLDSNISIVLGAFFEGELVGFLVAGKTQFDIEIYFIVVTEAYKNQGIGEQLLGHLVKHAQEAGLEAVLLEVRISNQPARRLYEKLAFKEVGLRKAYYSSPIEDALLMRLDL